jgi:dTDP-4-dehydrorhamnose 3,5-epimerase
MAAHGLNPIVAESSISHNARAGTLRGLHYQAPPAEEAKVVACLRGRMWDVMVDLRKDSPTFRAWHAEVLDAEVGLALYIPEGVAHGFLTLTDDVMVLYHISTPWTPALARGVRWDDPALGIAWPFSPVVMSTRDRELPVLTPSTS